MTTPRRSGFALLAALWLVVAIATVALAFATEARARRVVAIGASDRGAQRAAALGGLAIARGRLERVLREQRIAGTAATALRSADPWLDADSLFTDTLDVGGARVRVAVEETSTRLLVNGIAEDELRSLVAYVTGDYTAGDEIAQSVADWMDADSLPRPRGGERDEYLADGRLVLPPNHPVREVEELRDVRGMTPELFAEIRPYLTAAGSGRINVNSAPVPVLRALPGMTDDVIARILAARSGQRRIRSLTEVAPPVGGAGGIPVGARNQLANRLSFDVNELQLTIRVVQPSDAHVETLRAVVARNGLQTFVSRVTW